MIISAEQLHGLLAAIRDQKIAVVEAIGMRPVGAGLVPGEQVRVDVLAKLPSGQSLTNLAGQLVNMQLPADIKPGESLRLTYVTGEPRPTFALSQSERQGTPTSVSDTARWLGQITREQTAAPSALPRPTLLLSAPPTNPQQLADRLRQTMAQSGVFYEAHLAEWATGERPLASVLREPQGSLSQPAAFQQAVAEGSPLAQRTASPGTAPLPVQQPSPTPEGSAPLPAQPAPPATAPAESAPPTSTSDTKAQQLPAPENGPPGGAITTPGRPADQPAAATGPPNSPEELPAYAPKPGGEAEMATPVDRQQAPAPPPASERQETPATSSRHPVQQPGEPGRADQAMEATPRSALLATTPGATHESAKAGIPLATADPADPRTIPLIREQLELLQNRTFTWQGEGWPGQPLKWQVEERDANPDEPGPRSWQSTLHLNLPRLGEVHASLHLSGKMLNIAITGSSAPAIPEFQAAVGKLREQLEAHGLSLNAFEVRNE